MRQPKYTYPFNAPSMAVFIVMNVIASLDRMGLLLPPDLARRDEFRWVM